MTLTVTFVGCTDPQTEAITVTIVSCTSNSITFDSSSADENYTILGSGSVATSLTSPSATQTNTADCTLGSATLEVRDQHTGEWHDYAGMADPPAWIQNYAAGASFDIDTTDSSLASEAFGLRFAIADNGSPTNYAYDTFTVTFAYECESDTLTALSSTGNADLDCIIGNSYSVSTALDSPGQSHTDCPLDVVMEVFLDSISDWVLYDDARSTLAPAISGYSSSTGGFTVDSSSMTTAELAAVQPLTVFNIRQTYISTDSLESDGTFIDYYSITIRNDCSDGVLTKGSDLNDVTYVDQGTADT